MAQVKVDDQINVVDVTQNRESKGKVTEVKEGGLLDITLTDGTELVDVPHVGPRLISWYVQDKNERLAARQPEEGEDGARVVELG